MPQPVSELYRGALLGLAVGERLASGEHAENGPLAQALILGEAIVARRGLAPAELIPKLSDGSASAPLARLAPVALYLFHDAARAKQIAAESARLTSASRESSDACRYLAGLLVGALRGERKERLLEDLYSPVYNYWLFERTALEPCVDAVARGDFLRKPAEEVPAGESPAETLASALWAFEQAATFAEGMDAALGIGGSGRERGAVYGQLAGLYYGAEAIPAEWIGRVEEHERIDALASSLLRGTAQGIRHFTTYGVQGAK